MTSRKPSRRNVYGEGSVYYSEKRQRWIGQLNVAPRGAKADRRERTGKTEREVRLKLKELRRQVDERRVGSERVTVQQWLSRWIETGDQKPRTKSGYRSIATNHVNPNIGGVPLTLLDWEHVDRLRRAISHRSPTTQRNVHRLLSASLNDALDQGLLPRNPFARSAPRKAHANRVAFAPEHLDLLLAAIEGTDDEFRWLMALVLGARQSECLGLTWDEVDLTPGNQSLTLRWQLQRLEWSHGPNCSCSGTEPAHRCHARYVEEDPRLATRHLRDNLYLVPLKTKSSNRIVPVPSFCVDALTRLRDEYEKERRDPRYHDHDLVFVRLGGAPRLPEYDAGAWRDLLSRAGVDHQVLHTARNTAATTLIRKGVSTRIVSEILGHSTAAMTDAYVTLTNEVGREALESLNPR